MGSPLSWYGRGARAPTSASSSPAQRGRVPSARKAGEGLLRRRPHPLRGDWLGPLVGYEPSAASLFFGADRCRILAELRPHGHRLLDGWPLGHFFEPALDVREFVDVDLAGRPARRPGVADHVGNRVLAGGQIALVE